MTDNLLDRVAALVAVESPTGDLEALAAAAEAVRALLAPLGGRLREHPGEMGTHLVLELDGHGSDSAPVLLVGHYDTVWPVGTLQRMPWTVADGVARGPGGYDMKSGLVVAAAALSDVLASGRPHPPVRLVVVADEEVGSPTSTPLLRSLAEGARAALGFESPHPGGPLKRGRHGSTRLRLRVGGRSAHAALDPGSGISAVDELVDQLVRLRALVDRPGVLCNVGSLTAPGRTNVVTDAAEAEIGLRFADPAVEQEVMAAVRAMAPVRAGARLEVEVLSSRPAWVPAGSDELLTTALRVAAVLGVELDPAPAAGGADTNTTGSLGVPTLDGLGPWGAGAHAEHEQFEVAALEQRRRLVAELLLALA
ncbi:M20/M25/M40 family metallo-hydrolase [Auraticoccus sp. F435]|uniref:M20/M25/M40 family metallo-hydrolase n=1 Tax=Auraticoccus cholistanensis TaxID=2656650 RepID=A0A6A9V1T9_9ACTN|nr:M20/M25/M40 family metallo-hydrolase [Auraticoccus cholistanensis]MVA77555.1 M20/M25/M40 family metallo-hydrolase [Auraticoccus cholistanensis]